MTTYSITTITMSQSVDLGYQVYLIDATNNDVSVDLPDINNIDGICLMFSRIDNSLNNVLLNGFTEDQTIGGTSEYPMPVGSYITIISSTNKWWFIS